MEAQGRMWPSMDASAEQEWREGPGWRALLGVMPRYMSSVGCASRRDWRTEKQTGKDTEYEYQGFRLAATDSFRE